MFLQTTAPQRHSPRVTHSGQGSVQEWIFFQKVSWIAHSCNLVWTWWGRNHHGLAFLWERMLHCSPISHHWRTIRHHQLKSFWQQSLQLPSWNLRHCQWLFSLKHNWHSINVSSCLLLQFVKINSTTAQLEVCNKGRGIILDIEIAWKYYWWDEDTEKWHVLVFLVPYCALSVIPM